MNFIFALTGAWCILMPNYTKYDPTKPNIPHKQSRLCISLDYSKKLYFNAF